MSYQIHKSLFLTGIDLWQCSLDRKKSNFSKREDLIQAGIFEETIVL